MLYQFSIFRQLFYQQMSGANKLSSPVANNLSGFQAIPRRYGNEEDRVARRGQENEILEA